MTANDLIFIMVSFLTVCKIFEMGERFGDWLIRKITTGDSAK